MNLADSIVTKLLVKITWLKVKVIDRDFAIISIALPNADKILFVIDSITDETLVGALLN